MGDFLNTDEKNEDKNSETKLTETILKLEEVGKNLYRANYLWKSSAHSVYGGQIIGQALVAAGKTVPELLHMHSMHCYFLLSGDVGRPIIYNVENMRDGKSFSTRLVKAIQNENVIFICMVSYHKQEFSPLMHQYKMPNVPSPDSLMTLEELLLESLSKGELTELQQVLAQRVLSNELSFHIKPIFHSRFKTNLEFLLPTEPIGPKLLFWVKMKGKIDKSQNNLHRCVVAYISDTYLLSTALLTIPREKYILSMISSLDHSIWFHSHFSADEWMLYEGENLRMIGSRALNFGRIWNQDGTLAVSVAQEGRIRFASSL